MEYVKDDVSLPSQQPFVRPNEPFLQAESYHPADGALLHKLRSPSDKLFDRFVDLLLATPALLFLIFAFICMAIHEKPVDEAQWGHTVIAAAKLVSLIFG